MATQLKQTAARLYEDDFYVWTQRQAEALRARRLEDLDLEHLAEEVEDLGTALRSAVVVDTGASDIALSPNDARRLGFRLRDLRFERRYQTANGEISGAPVRLRELRIGQQSLFDLEAVVVDAPLEVALLGMSFLRRLDGYAVQDGGLMLRW